MGRRYELQKPSSSSTTRTMTQGMGIKIPKIPMMMGNDSRLVYLVGNVDEDSISEVQQQLLDLASDSKEPIHLVVSTYGGAVHEMFSLYDVMRFIPAPVYTVGLGKVMSAGSLILAAGSSGHRMIGRSTRVMIHALSAGFIGNLFELANELEEVQKLQEMYIERMATETKMTKEQVHDLLHSKVDRVFSPEQAIEMGIVDKII